MGPVYYHFESSRLGKFMNGNGGGESKATGII